MRESLSSLLRLLLNSAYRKEKFVACITFHRSVHLILRMTIPRDNFKFFVTCRRLITIY